VVRARVARARAIQRERLRGTPARCNGEMSAQQVRRFCRLGPSEERTLHGVIEALRLSARARDRIVKVARTVADLRGREEIDAEHISTAAQYRTLDRVETSEAVAFQQLNA
jgi:magnesium chelatase family protein